MAQMYKIRTKNKNVFLRVAKGHFATSHSHTNYFIDVTTQKTRLSEAKAVAKELHLRQKEKLAEFNAQHGTNHEYPFEF